MAKLKTIENGNGFITIPGLNVGFDGTERWRFETVLTDLLPHLSRSKVVLAGGIALRHHLITRGVPYPDVQFRDLDLLIEDPSNIIMSSTDSQDKGFIFSHFHPQKNKKIIAEFFIKMIHTLTGTKIDLFSYSPLSPSNFQIVSFQGKAVKIPTPESLLIVTLLDTLKALDAFKKAPRKRLISIDLLCGIVDFTHAQQEWQKQHSDGTSLLDAIAKIQRLSLTNPEIFVDKVFGKKPIADCSECVHTPEFPIASRDSTRNILGVGLSKVVT